jgi:hypothetical protein
MKRAWTAISLIIFISISGYLAGIWLARAGKPTSGIPTSPISSARGSIAPSVRETAPQPPPPAPAETGSVAKLSVAPKLTPRSATEPKPPAIRTVPTLESELKPGATPIETGRAPTPAAAEPAPEPSPIPQPPAPPPITPNPALVPPAVSSSAAELTAVQRVLDHYQQAYDQLDAAGAASVWPGVDVPALSKMFGQLQRQHLNFEGCVFALSGSKATVQCTGSLSYVRRVGDATPRTERHSWTIDLERSEGAWQIVQVSGR